MHGYALMAGRSTRRGTHAWCAHIALMHDRCDLLYLSSPSYYHGYGPEQAGSICWQSEVLEALQAIAGAAGDISVISVVEARVVTLLRGAL